MDNEKQKTLIINCLKAVMKANLEILELHKSLFKDNKESMTAILKNIRITKKAMNNVDKINHIEILRSIYGNIIAGKETIFALTPVLINSKKCKYWDTTKSGFDEFMRLEKEAEEIQKTKFEQQAKEQEAIKKAKEEGKRVEYTYDPITKTTKPMIIDEDNNA